MASARLIAFYLPRFHPLPEDEGWRGKGFTDWLEAARARPLFEGHYQPHLPADLGFYDQRLPQTLRDQVQTAKDHGIDGFCHLYYWFSGQRLLGAPLDAMLADPESKMPFCLCWANESWTRRGPDGRLETLIAQGYGPQDDLDFIRGVAPYLKDPRYIRAGGAPLLLVRRPQQLPDARKSAGIWRELCREAGVGDIHLCAALTHGNEDYARLGFDSGVELPPHNLRVASAAHRIRFTQPFRGSVALYEDMARFSLERARPGRNVFLTVVPSWDNTARAGSGALVVLNGTPANYEFWLAQALRKAEQCFPGQERPVFINAWNDWAQGCHIEPDQKHGRAFLEATLRAKRGDCRLAGFPDVGVPGDGPAQGKPYVAKAAASHAATPPAPAAKAAMTPSHPTGFLRRLGLNAPNWLATLGASIKADRQAAKPKTAPARLEMVPALLEALLRAKGRLVIIQIGAHVGATGNDPIFKFIKRHCSGAAGRNRPRCTAILVEPVRCFFDQLVANYADCSGVRCENVAIAESAGERDFHRLREGLDLARHGIPDWADQCGSLLPDHLSKMWDCEFVRANTVVEKVRCLTFDDLIARHHLRDIDLLQIDAEGYDYDIIATIDFPKVRPLHIIYERMNLGPKEPACRKLLLDQGYSLEDLDKTDLGVENTLCSLNQHQTPS